MYEAHLQYGYTLKEIAEYIGVHYSTVSRAIKRQKVSFGTADQKYFDLEKNS
jgi:IS30 family transposase